MPNERPEDEFFLHYFIEQDDLFWCKVLIFLGADVNEPGPVRNWIEPVSPLWWSIYKQSNIKIMKLLLEHGADPNCYDLHTGTTPLLMLCKMPNNDKTRLLLKYNANIKLRERDGCCFLHNYIPPRIFTEEDKQFLNEMFKLCIEGGLDVNTANNVQEIPIHLACTRGNLYIIRYLLEHGADPNIPTIAGEISLHEFLNMKYYDKHASFMANGIDDTLDCLRLLIKGTLDINAKSFDGHSPLHSLCKKPYDISAALYIVMVTAGADPHQLSAHGCNILHTLSRSHPIGSVKVSDLDELVKAILKDGVDINGEDYDGRTPLMLAIMNGLFTFVPILLANGADINKTDKNKRSALHYFIIDGFDSMIDVDYLELLIRNNADVFAKDIFGKAAIDYVRNLSEENCTVIDYLSGKKPVNKKLTKSWLRLTKETIDLNVSDFTSSCSLIDHLLSTPYIGLATLCEEYTTVYTQVELLISRLVKVMNVQSSSFQFTPKLSGSVSENTKVGFPDEFDYLLTVNDVDRYIKSSECESGFVYLEKRDDETLPETFKSFFDINGTFNRLDFVLYFIKLVVGSLQNKAMWDDLNFYLDYKNYDSLYYWDLLDVKVTDQLISRPNFILHLLFPVSRFNGLLPISIDLVPAIEINVECPHYLVNGRLNAKMKGDRIYAVPKEISDYLSVEKGEKSLNRMRISTSTMERRIFNEAPECFRKVYIVLKILCQRFSDDIGTYEIKNEWFRLLENLLLNDKLSTEMFMSEWSSDKIMEYVMRILIKLESDHFGKDKDVFSFFFPSMRIIKKVRNRPVLSNFKELMVQLSEMDYCIID